MKRYLTPLVIALVAFASIGAAESLGLLERQETARQHLQKTFAEPAAIAAEGSIGPTPCRQGTAAGFPCHRIDLLSFTPASSFAGESGFEALGGGLSDIWGWVDPENGDEYVIVGETNGAGLFRVTDPTAPEYLGEVAGNPGAQLIWYDIKVYEDHAFIVSESNPSGMKVFDLTRLRDAEALEPGEQRTFEPDAEYPLSVAAHNLAINTDTGYAYIVGGNAGLVVPDQCRSGLHMVDINDPKNPVFAGCYLTEGGPGTAGGVVGAPDSTTAAYVHDTQCVLYDGPDNEHDGREICFNSSETHLSIVDVTDKTLPTLLGTLTYDNVDYTHQGWLTDDHATFLLGDEGDETGFGTNTRTLILDVSDLDAPTSAGDGEHVHETAAIDHNMYVRGDLVFQSNYRAGLRVLDLKKVDRGQLTEKAFFDVYPQDDEAEFDGTWSNYPYFPSGNIAVSAYDGLFMVRLDDGLMNAYGLDRDRP